MGKTPIQHMMVNEDTLADEFDAILGYRTSHAGLVLAGASDSTPDAFSFTDQTNVAPSATVTSAPITVAGIDTPAAITVTGGAYSINGGSYTSSPGTVENGDEIRAQHTASAEYGAVAVNTVVTIGGVSDTFTSTTAAYPGHTYVTFDGTNDYLRKTTGSPIVAPDATYWTLAFKLKDSAFANGTFIRLQSATQGLLTVNTGTTGSNHLQCSFRKEAAGVGRGLITVASSLATNTDYTVHLAASSADNRLRCWVNGIETSESTPTPITWNLGTGTLTWAADVIEATIGSANAGGSKVSVSCGFVWFTAGTTSAHYITDQTKFYNSGDVNLGSIGQNPMGGTQPLLFYGGVQNAAAWNAGTNLGTCGNFTMNGAVS